MHGIARRSADSQELHCRPRMITYRGDVAVPIGIELRGNHHDVPFAIPDEIEDLVEGQPRFDLACRSSVDGPRAAHG